MHMKPWWWEQGVSAMGAGALEGKLRPLNVASEAEVGEPEVGLEGYFRPMGIWMGVKPLGQGGRKPMQT
jgi:hypothetical protein